MKKVFLVLIYINMALLADMNRSDIGIVTDSNTGLEWQDNYTDNGNIIKETGWKKAVQYCHNLSLGGKNWRLPNINELLSIVDYNYSYPSLKKEIFQNTNKGLMIMYDGYWSSTQNANNVSAWLVRFIDGSTDTDMLGSYHHVRCVRAGRD